MSKNLINKLGDHPKIYNPKLSWHIMPSETEYIIALKEQGVSNFDPIQYHKNKLAELETDELVDNKNLSQKERKERKKNKTSKNAMKFIEENIQKKEMQLREQENNQISVHLDKVEQDNIEILSSKVRSMRTNYGRIKIKVKLLDILLNKDLTTASHLIFYSLNDEVDEVDDEQLNNLIQVKKNEYIRKYSNLDMIEVQMKNLSSFLPPLDPFSKIEYKLDDWQLSVFEMISDKKNILICAPTSAGKTVCSTYCAILGNKTIFVVPSDELARQVGGIFRNMDGVSVKIVTNKEYFPEDIDNELDTHNENDKFKVLVGTPIKVEEYLTLNGHSQFTYAIFDEWHMLNSKEGASLENIFKMINCPFLALSATLESPQSLKEWMEEVKSKEVNLIEYDKRFIIQQRFLYINNTLKHLHPLSSLDIEYLKSDEFLNCNLSFTPRDSFDLYTKLKNVTGNENIHPRSVLNKGNWDRITLNDTLKYEKFLKSYLNNLAKENEELAKEILNEFKVNDNEDIDFKYDFVKLIKLLVKNKMCPAIFFKVNPRECLELYKYIVNSLLECQNIKYPFHYEDLEFKQSYFLKLEKDKEDAKKRATIPKDTEPDMYMENIYKKIEEKLLDELKNKYQIVIDKRINKINNDVEMESNKKQFYTKYYNKELNQVLEQKYITYIDKNRPHPEFCFNDQKIDSQMMRGIRKDIKNLTGDLIDYEHPFMIGIERGIIPYFRDMEVPYQRIAQSLFSQKKIPIVISDESLAYGINLPIRTVVMIGDNNREIDSVIASQMSGRSGRRGIDREGNVIYVNLNWRNVLRGKYSKLEGKNPSGYHLALPYYFKKYYNKEHGQELLKEIESTKKSHKNDEENLKTLLKDIELKFKDKELKKDIKNLFSKSLFKFTNNLDYNEKQDMSRALNVLKKYELRKPINSLIAWCLRSFGKNTIHVAKLLDIFNMYDHFQIFEVILALIDNHSEVIEKESNERLNFIFENIDIELFDPKYLLGIYKQNKISKSDDIDRLKNIANFISILHSILISDLKIEDVNIVNNEEKIQNVSLSRKYKLLIQNLEKIFKNLKVIIKKSLF